MSHWFDQAFSESYLTLYQHRSDEQAEAEVEWIVDNLMANKESRVLDLCCGNGRHCRAFARRGIQSIGLDRSLELLASACAQSGSNESYLCGDMRAVPLQRPFGLITNLFTSFGYFADESDDLQTLREVRRLLSPTDGRLVLDFLNASLVRRTLVPEDTKEIDGNRIVQRRTLSSDGTRVVKFVEFESTSGERRQWEESVRLHDEGSLRSLAHDAGLSVVDLLGGLDGCLFQENSPRLVLVLEKTHV